METVYDYTIKNVRRGVSFNVSFESRSLTVGGKKIIRGGEYKGELGVPVMSLNDALDYIEFLYDRYKHSVPSERSERKRKLYFKALPENKLDDIAMMYGTLRDEAQVALELSILCLIINSSLVWNCGELCGKWFWKSTKDNDLVILRQWVENK